MREIALDTETTGLDPNTGDRIVEIGCVEMENHIPTGESLQIFVNPERDIPEDSQRIHGITDEFIADKPIFAKIADTFLDFIGDAVLVIHNADFDVKFLNAEFARLDMPPLSMDRVIDTVKMARKKFPGSPASLDALCRRFGIDNAHRTFHGALKDSDLLASVYLELIGGREPGLILANLEKKSETRQNKKTKSVARAPRTYAPSDAELQAHTAFLEKIKEPIWEK